MGLTVASVSGRRRRIATGSPWGGVLRLLRGDACHRLLQSHERVHWPDRRLVKMCRVKRLTSVSMLLKCSGLWLIVTFACSVFILALILLVRRAVH